jgi:hypothetical protein
MEIIDLINQKSLYRSKIWQTLRSRVIIVHLLNGQLICCNIGTIIVRKDPIEIQEKRL